jgi:hypothetical protein
VSRKPRRVPGTFRERAERFIAVAEEHMEPGGVYRIQIAHDDGCPALETQRLRDCRCEPEFRRPRRIA